jgi:hypothetical protein
MILIEQSPPAKPSFYAAQGTAAHEIGERFLRQRLVVDTRYEGEVIAVDGFDIDINPEITDAVDVYVNTVYDDMSKYNSPSHRLHVEVGFDLRHLDPDAFGTCDAMLYVPYNRLIVYDYKHGAGIAVDAMNNKQCLYYALGAFRQLPKDEQDDLEFVETVIVQPRCPHDGGIVRRAIYRVADLIAFEAELSRAIGRVRSGDATLCAGPHCKFCPAKPICTEAKNEVARKAALDFSEVADGPPDVKTLTPDEIAHLLTFVPFIKDWCDSLLAYAYTEAERGVTIPGYKLVDKKSNRKWVDPANVVEEYGWILGDKLWSKSLLSPAQLEKLLPKAEREDLTRFWEKPVAGKTLVPVSDDRETRMPKAITDFMDVEI